MPEMSPDERRAFLSDGTRTGMVATTRRDGRPIWFGLDGDDLLFVTSRTSALARRYGDLNAGDGMLLVRLSPEHVLSDGNVVGE